MVHVRLLDLDKYKLKNHLPNTETELSNVAAEKNILLEGREAMVFHLVKESTMISAELSFAPLRPPTTIRA